jgi:hypothetical protein
MATAVIATPLSMCLCYNREKKNRHSGIES